MSNEIRFSHENNDGDEVEISLPSRYEVCPCCEGKGSHDHPAFSNGITSSEWAEWDQEEREDYQKGIYDVPCEECKGLRVILVPDEERCDKADLALWEEKERAAFEERQNERRAERYGY